jgi:hypothetical protein
MYTNVTYRDNTADKKMSVFFTLSHDSNVEKDNTCLAVEFTTYASGEPTKCNLFLDANNIYWLLDQLNIVQRMIENVPNDARYSL